MGRRFHSEPIRGKKEWKTGQGVGSVPGACNLCAPLVLGSEWRKKLAGFMSTRPLLLLINPIVRFLLAATSSTLVDQERPLLMISDAQVLAGTCFQCLPMEEVAGCLNFPLLSWA